MQTETNGFPHLDKLASKIKTLIFDLDGTLLDSMGVWNQVDIDFLGEFGYEVTDEYTDMVKKNNIRDAADYTVKEFHLPLTPEEVIDRWNSMVEYHYHNTIMLKAGAKEYLLEAKEKGFHLAAATALGKDYALASLENNGVLNLFDAVITLDDIGSRADKRDPKIYIKAMEKSGGKDAGECVVFEDVKDALEGAKSGGFLTCAVYDKIGMTPSEWDLCSGISDYQVLSWKNVK